MKSRLCLPILSVLLGLCLLAGSSSAHAQASTTTTNLRLPLDTTLANPCTGELITFGGTIHLVIHATTTPSGDFHATVHQNLQNASGIAAESGDTFQFQFGTTETLNVAAGTETTLSQNLRVVGPGPDNNFLLHQTTHLTINPNGEATAVVDNFFATCR
jgi:hypothetical protein